MTTLGAVAMAREGLPAGLEPANIILLALCLTRAGDAKSVRVMKGVAQGGN
jgi:hypothetical protein